MNKLKQLGKGLLFLFVMLGFRIWCSVVSSPEPFIRWFRRLPDPGPIAPNHYEEYEALVEIVRDVEYSSAHGSNHFDYYYPKSHSGKLPTILWVHGGAFVAGDKSGTAYWCTMIASRGYAVVSMNYEAAPEAKYPAPVLQVAEVYAHLKASASGYPALDLTRLIIGGDSAGAQIASQFLAVQTNPELSGRTGIKPSIPLETIKAALLYCGPYNVKRLADVKGRIERFYLNQLGWAYMGERNWSESVKSVHASTVHHITGQYPPVFLTDGNTGSFEKHGKELEEKLKSMGVPVTSLFFPLSHGNVHHEYQFKLNTDEAMLCFEMTLAFLQKSLLPMDSADGDHSNRT